MTIIADILLLLIALLHIYILVLEMFFWDKPLGLRAFNQTVEHAQISKSLAANQGLYNGFLAAGLVWGVAQGADGFSAKIFFLVCIFIAGIFGALTASRKILFIQSVPALIGLLVVILSRVWMA